MSLKFQEDIPNICKVVLVGETGVGKTSISNRYVNDIFSEKEISTKGVEYLRKKVTFPEYNDKQLVFELWDTAGQEKYLSLTKIFYQASSIAIMVYDITRKETYEKIKNFWYNQMLNFAPKNIVIAIVGNKADIIEHDVVDQNEVEEWAASVGVIFQSTSAKKNTGIKELFQAVGEKLLDKRGVPKKRETIVIGKDEYQDKSKGCC